MHLVHKTFLGSLFILSPLSAAIAAEVLPTITVTANRTETAVEKTLAAVTVIDREQIERQQFNTLQDLLRTIPSIAYTNSGGMGQTTGISIRGTNSNAVLVLVDGQKVGSASLGQTAFEHYPIDQIERVEVVRGPRSSLYGSEAIGGVIQIFTRKGRENGVKPFASVSYGSHETYQGNVGVNIRQNNSWATLSVAGTKTQGFDATTSKVDVDKDGYENGSVSFRAGHAVNQQLALDANILLVNGKNEYDIGNDLYSDIEQNVYGLGLTYSPNTVWTAKLKVGRSEDKLETPKYSYEINTTRDTFSWINTLNLGVRNTVLMGYDFQTDEVDGLSSYQVKERDNHGYFVQYLGQFDSLSLQGSLRQDDNDQFGEHTTGNISLGYQFNTNILAYVNYGTAFKAPTFNDLYSPSGGNHRLVPEESKNFEFGLKGNYSSFNWELNAFHNGIDDLIIWRPISPGSWTWYASQVDKARIQGVEAVIGQTLDKWTWNANYTYQEPENRSNGAAHGKQISYRAKQLFNISADYMIDQWVIGGSIHAEDRRYTDSEGLNLAYLPGFAIADVRVTYQATPELSIQAKLANIFDKEYQTNPGYNQDERTAWVTLRYAMK